jgi:galactose mutarotase-like enzyme
MTAPSSWVTLQSAALRVDIDPLGAQLSTLTDAQGRDLLWNGDPAIWAGRAPLLFPIVGAVAGGRYRVGSQVLSLSRHGFARGSRFEVVNVAAASACFRLQADEATLRVYPFRFELDVLYALEGATLSITSTVRNLDSKPLPASFGYHPAFRWPLPYGEPRAAHFLEFERDEPAPVRRLDGAGLLSPERHPSPVVGRRLALDDALFEGDALIFDTLASRRVRYGAARGPRIEVEFPDSPYLGIWSKRGAGFVCIEPWHGIADPAGFDGDFSTKPGIFSVAPAAAFAQPMDITLRG